MKKYLKFLPFGLSILSAFVMWGVTRYLGILPFKYEILLFAPVLCGVFLIFAIFLRVKSNFAKVLAQILSVLIAIGLLMGSYFISRGTRALDKISKENKVKTYTMSVVVMNDSEYQDIHDLANLTLGMNTSSDNKNITIATEAIKAIESSILFDIFEKNSSMVDALYNGRVQSMLINESSRTLFEEQISTFSEDTRVIWTYEVTEDAVNVRKSVNVVNTPFTIYVSGIDTYGPISTVSRSDVNMLLTVNPNTKEIIMTSIPRDCWVEMDDVKAYDKLTHSGIEGIENSIRTLENFLDLEINYYARVNFSSVISIVDALDGITVVSNYDLPNIGIYAGENYIYGETALAFSRERHSYDYMFEDSERGDQIRVESQQAVIKGIIRKMMTPSLLLNYTDILDAMEGMFETNMSSKEIAKLVQMQLTDMSDWNFINLKIAGSYEYRYGGAYMPDWELIYYIPDESSVQKCRATIQKALDNQIIQ